MCIDGLLDVLQRCLLAVCITFCMSRFSFAGNEMPVDEPIRPFETERYKDTSHRLLFNLNIEWSDAAGKNQDDIDVQ